MARRQLLTCAALLAALLLPGCKTPDATYVQADRALYTELAPAHRRYVEADPTLSDEQKARRLRLLDAWDLRIRQAEAALR